MWQTGNVSSRLIVRYPSMTMDFLLRPFSYFEQRRQEPSRWGAVALGLVACFLLHVATYSWWTTRLAQPLAALALKAGHASTTPLVAAYSSIMGANYLTVWLGAALFLFAGAIVMRREDKGLVRIFDLSGLALYSQIVALLVLLLLGTTIPTPEGVDTPALLRAYMLSLDHSPHVMMFRITQGVFNAWWMILIAAAFRSVMPMSTLRTLSCAGLLYMVFFGAPQLFHDYL